MAIKPGDIIYNEADHSITGPGHKYSIILVADTETDLSSIIKEAIVVAVEDVRFVNVTQTHKGLIKLVTC